MRLIDILRYCDGMSDEEIDELLKEWGLDESPVDEENSPF